MKNIVRTFLLIAVAILWASCRNSSTETPTSQSTSATSEGYSTEITERTDTATTAAGSSNAADRTSVPANAEGNNSDPTAARSSAENQK